MSSMTGKGENMKYRHEYKHEISYSDMLLLRQRLSAVARPDEHATDGRYTVRSLYFDNVYDKALREKIDGVNKREKFRIRYYNNDLSVIHLEKKSKDNGLCLKESISLSKEQVQSIIDGDYDWMMKSTEPLINELYLKMINLGLRPKTIVEYTREPFVYAPGNVRVTIDYNIRTGLGGTDFLNAKAVTIPAGNSPVILEVKWDEYLPDIIKAVVALKNRKAAAFSKYAACRYYG